MIAVSEADNSMVADNRCLKGSISALSYEFCSVFGEHEVHDPSYVRVVVICSVDDVELSYERVGAVSDILGCRRHAVDIEHP